MAADRAIECNHIQLRPVTYIGFCDLTHNLFRDLRRFLARHTDRNRSLDMPHCTRDTLYRVRLEYPAALVMARNLQLYKSQGRAKCCTCHRDHPAYGYRNLRYCDASDAGCLSRDIWARHRTLALRADITLQWRGSTSAASISTATDRMIRSIDSTIRNLSFLRTRMPSAPVKGPLLTRTRWPIFK